MNRKEWIEKANEEYKMLFSQVEKTCEFHHASLTRRYVSRRIAGYIKPYKGMFGVGYKVYKPYGNSTQYSIVEYWIEK